MYTLTIYDDNRQEIACIKFTFIDSEPNLSTHEERFIISGIIPSCYAAMKYIAAQQKGFKADLATPETMWTLLNCNFENYRPTNPSSVILRIGTVDD